jgi:SAM-dependent methyltransferase
MPVDPHAQRGFGAGADAYERHRPGWPPAAVERALTEVRAGASSTVVDVGAGTGKLTRELVRRVGRAVAVEPSADMRRRLAELVPGAEVVAGAADAIPLPDGTADAAFAAEAFHWFATRDAVAELARVLRPGGGLALLWNLYEWDAGAPWVEEVRTVLGEHLAPAFAAVDRNRPESWREPFAGAPFEAFEHFDVRHSMRTDADGLVAHVSTWSHTRVLDEPARAELLRELEAVLHRAHPTPDEIEIRFRTEVHWTQRA